MGMRRELIGEVVGQHTTESSGMGENGFDYVAFADKWMEALQNEPPGTDFPLPRLKGMEHRVLFLRFYAKRDTSQIESELQLSKQETLELIETVARKIYKAAIRGI